MSALPPAYPPLLDDLIAKTRQALEDGLSPTSLCFVGNLTSGELQPVLMDVATVAEKEATAALVRQVAVTLEADFVFSILLTWGLPPERQRQSAEIIQRYGSISASPHAIDAMAFILETRYGIWMDQVPLKPKGHSKRRRTFVTPQLKKMQAAVGRFVQLLPAKDEPDGPAPVLH